MLIISFEYIMTKGICLYLLVLCFYLSFQKRLGGFKRVEYDKGDLIMEKALKSAESVYIFKLYNSRYYYECDCGI